MRGNAIETTSETGSTGAVRDIAPGSRNQTIAGAIKALFKAAVKAVTQPNPDALQPKTKRRRSGGTESRAPLISVLPQRIAACGRYTALRTGKTKAEPGPAGLGMETPLDQSGSFNLSLCNSFGGFEGAGGDYGSEVFDAPDASVNLISLGL